MDEFLRLEYESCMDLLKYYDERNVSLMKFTTGVSSAVVSIVFGFYALGTNANQYFWHFASVLTGIVGLGLIAIVVALVQNRLYFVYPARQINAIRNTMLSTVEDCFSSNQMYTTTDVRAFKFLSLHALMNLLVTLQVGLFWGFCFFSIAHDEKNITGSVIEAVIVAAAPALDGSSC